MEYNDEAWNFAKDFDENWLTSISESQSGLIPLDLVKQSKQWFEYLPMNPPSKSRYRCKVCNKHAKKFKVKPQFMPHMGRDEGLLFDTPERNEKEIRDHEKNPTHLKLKERLKEDQQNAGLFNDISYIEKSRTLITSKVMLSVYSAVKHMGASFQSMEHLVDLQEINGLDMGSQCKTAATLTNMAASISKTMHNRLITSLQQSSSPISIIVDGSTDKSNKHLLAVLFQTLEEDVPVTYYYGLLELKTDETAEGQTDVLMDKLKTDLLFPQIKNRVISFVSDGASVMTGKKQSMAKLLKKEFGPQLISVHCGAHRVELVYGNAMKEFDSFSKIEEESNFLYSFYSRSHKRFGWLNDYLKENDYKPFKLNYIDEVRWVASHRSAVKKIYDHLPELIGHLTEIVNNREPTPSESLKKTKKKAQQIFDFLTDKNAILLMVFNLDAQAVFQKQSLVFQSNEESVISYSGAKQEMIAGMNSLRYMDDESDTKKFLASTTCDDGEPCGTIQGYEQSRVATWTYAVGETIRLENKANTKFDKLSEIKTGYLDTIEEKLNKYFPEIGIMDFDMLDQRLWQDDITEDQVKDKFVSITKELRWTRPRVLGKEFFRLMNQIRASNEWCTTQKSKPNWFWSSILKNSEFTMSDGLKNIIRAAMVIPVGSAAAERTFYQMNYIKTKQRARLTPATIDHICRIRMNGVDARCICMEKYTDEYLLTHEPCDPLFDRNTKKFKRSNDEDDYNTKPLKSNIFD